MEHYYDNNILLLQWKFEVEYYKNDVLSNDILIDVQLPKIINNIMKNIKNEMD